MLRLIVCFASLFFISCAHRPIEDLVLADVALKAAQKAKADAFAPDFFRKAENFYLRAKKDYTEGYFDSSRKFADDARRTAEQAEYQALLKQSQSSRGRPAEESFDMPPPAPARPSYEVEEGR